MLGGLFVSLFSVGCVFVSFFSVGCVFVERACMADILYQI